MDKEKYNISDFLFPNTSFLIGFGSILNINGNYFSFNESSTEEEADSKAIRSDWGVTGQDIYNAIEKIDSLKINEVSEKV